MTIKRTIEHSLRSLPHLNQGRTLPKTPPDRTTVIAELLESLHSDCYPLLNRGKRKWPIALWTDCLDTSGNIDHLLGTLNPDFSADIALADALYLQELQHTAECKLFNGTTFILEHAAITNNGFTLNCGLGRYFDALMTCDSLHSELFLALQQGLPANGKALLHSCPKRHAFLRLCPDPAFSGKARSAAIGISILVACKHDDQYFGLLGIRSGRVATDPGHCHVVPSGMFSTETNDPFNEFSLYHNFLREYQEELFEKSDLKAPELHSSHDWFYQRPALQYLMSLMKNGGARLLVTGYATNLMNYRPEVLLLLIIDDQGWLNQSFGDHCEFTAPTKGGSGGNLVPIDLSGPEEELLTRLNHLPGELAPPAVAALFAGRDLLKHITGP